MQEAVPPNMVLRPAGPSGRTATSHSRSVTVLKVGTCQRPDWYMAILLVLKRAVALRPAIWAGVGETAYFNNRSARSWRAPTVFGSLIVLLVSSASCQSPPFSQIQGPSGSQYQSCE